MLSWLNWRFSIGLDVKPLTTGVELRPEGLYSGVFLEDDAGLSKGRRGGVKLFSSRSRLILTGAKVAGAELTGVKPPALTGVKPDVTGGVWVGVKPGVNPGANAPGGGAWSGESSIGMLFIFFSNSSFMDALRASEARMAGDSPRRLDGVFW